MGYCTVVVRLVSQLGQVFGSHIVSVVDQQLVFTGLEPDGILKNLFKADVALTN